MKKPQHHPRCQVYLHPAATSNPAAIHAIQQQAGLLLIITPKKKRAQSNAPLTRTDEINPWGGDAA